MPFEISCSWYMSTHFIATHSFLILFALSLLFERVSVQVCVRLVATLRRGIALHRPPLHVQCPGDVDFCCQHSSQHFCIPSSFLLSSSRVAAALSRPPNNVLSSFWQDLCPSYSILVPRRVRFLPARPSTPSSGKALAKNRAWSTALSVRA